uniref:Uncharacterized protein n=1 Tax=Pundamilia nyererei TaxID=303518 RepID=A0A3B4F8E7_9CICH
MVVPLKQQLQNAKEELKKQAEEHEDEKEALRSEIKQLKGLKEQNEEKLMSLEKELNDTKASYIALLEEQKKENANFTQCADAPYYVPKGGRLSGFVRATCLLIGGCGFSGCQPTI